MFVTDIFKERSSKESSCDRYFLIIFLKRQKFKLKGTITLGHCKRHDTIIMFFDFDGFHSNHGELFSDKFYCR